MDTEQDEEPRVARGLQEPVVSEQFQVVREPDEADAEGVAQVSAADVAEAHAQRCEHRPGHEEHEEHEERDRERPADDRAVGPGAQPPGRPGG